MTFQYRTFGYPAQPGLEQGDCASLVKDSDSDNRAIVGSECVPEVNCRLPDVNGSSEGCSNSDKQSSNQNKLDKNKEYTNQVPTPSQTLSLYHANNVDSSPSKTLRPSIPRGHNRI